MGTVLFGQARYELPPRASLWQSAWVGSSQQYGWILPSSWTDEEKIFGTCAVEGHLMEHCTSLMQRFVNFVIVASPSPCSALDIVTPPISVPANSKPDDVVAWDSEGDEATSSYSSHGRTDSEDESCREEKALLEKGEDAYEDEDWQENDESDSLDVDPLESGEACPLTPPRKHRPALKTPEKTGQADPGVSCNPGIFHDERIDDSSSDDDSKHGPYCNESEQR